MKLLKTNLKILRSKLYITNAILSFANSYSCYVVTQIKINFSFSHKKYVKPLVQSLIGLITEFLKKYSIDENCSLKHCCETLKTIEEIDLSKSLPKFHNIFKCTYRKILSREVKKFIEELEEPYSEIHVRALLTGILNIL